MKCNALIMFSSLRKAIPAEFAIAQNPLSCASLTGINCDR